MGNYEYIIKLSNPTLDSNDNIKSGTKTITKYPSNQFYTEYNDFKYKSVEKYVNGKTYLTDRIYAGRKGVFADITYVTRDNFYTNTNQIQERTKTTLYSDANVSNPYKLTDIKTKITSKYNRSNKMTSNRTTSYDYYSSKKEKGNLLHL